jgi:integrase
MKLEGNQVSRKRLSLEQFWQVHELAPLHLQVAMQLSLVTLQARAEVCNMQRDDIRNGELYVARAKTAGSDDAAFIRIQMSEEIERIIALGRQSGIACPYFVHRRPRMKPRRNAAPLPHWAWVKPQAISVAFKDARDRSGVSDGYGPREAPSFHEIRSLGARLMKEQGADKKLIQTLLAHGQASTSALYLDARETVPDERYVSVAATLKLLP